MITYIHEHFIFEFLTTGENFVLSNNRRPRPPCPYYAMHHVRGSLDSLSGEISENSENSENGAN